MALKDQIGSFCWWSLMTKDVAKANDFYQKLFEWMNYFSVKSVDESLDKAKSLGGRIVMPKMEIPETGYFACIEDPTGAHSYLFELLGK